MEEVLNAFDAGKVFDERIQAALNEALGPQAKRTAPFDEGDNIKERNEAFAARCRDLRKAGHDWVLDLKTTYGLFGTQGRLVAAIEGTLYETRNGRKHWRGRIAAASDPILASDKPGDPTKPFGFKVSSKLSAEEDAVTRWTKDQGAAFRGVYEAVTSGAAEALVQELRLKTSAKGAYWLGRQAMQDKDFERAAALFAQAYQLDPSIIEAEDGRAVALAGMGDLAGAAALAEQTLQADPKDAAAHYNLAWWYAVKMDAAEKAKPHYEAALGKGLPRCKDIEKKIGKDR